MRQYTLAVVGCIIIMGFVYNLLLFPTVKHLWKSVRFWQSYRHQLVFSLHLSPRCNWKKTAGNWLTCFGVKVPRTLDYPTVNLNPR